MILCPNGHPNPEGATHCEVCDAYIDTITAPPAPEPEPVPPVLALAPASLSIAQGSEAGADLQVRNDGPAPDDFVLDALGTSAGWVTIEPTILSVANGASGNTRVTVRPPADASPGPGGVTIRATGATGATAQIELVFDVPAPPEPAALNGRIDPFESRGTTHGDHVVTVENPGSSPALATVQGSDPADAVTLAFEPSSLSVGSAATASARLRVTPRSQVWVGRSRVHPFQVSIVPEGGPPTAVEGRMVQRPRIPAWLPPLALSLLAAFGIVVTQDGGGGGGGGGGGSQTEQPQVVRTVDFETPALGALDGQFVNPFSADAVTFSIEGTPGFDDAAVGVVKNRATSACVDPPDDDQKLGTGRETLGGVGLAAFPMRAEFTEPLQPGSGVVSISVEFQSGAGAQFRLRLFDPSGIEVAQSTVPAAPPNGTCGFPGDPRARTVVTAETSSIVAFAIIDEELGGRVFVIDDFTFSSAA